MARNVFTVMATQVSSNGQYSTVTGFPKRFDSDSYNGDVDKALRRAKSAYHARLMDTYASDALQMSTVTLSEANGNIIMNETEGQIVTPAPEPEGEGE